MFHVLAIPGEALERQYATQAVQRIKAAFFIQARHPMAASQSVVKRVLEGQARRHGGEGGERLTRHLLHSRYRHASFNPAEAPDSSPGDCSFLKLSVARGLRVT